MDGRIDRIERAGPQPAARARRVANGEHDPFTLDGIEPRGDEEHADDEHHDADEDEGRDERPIAPRAEDESGGRIDLTA